MIFSHQKKVTFFYGRIPSNRIPYLTGSLTNHEKIRKKSHFLKHNPNPIIPTTITTQQKKGRKWISFLFVDRNTSYVLYNNLELFESIYFYLVVSLLNFYFVKFRFDLRLTLVLLLIFI